MIADVAAEAIRGRTQTAIYTTRTFYSIFVQLFIGFGLNMAVVTPRAVSTSASWRRSQ